MTKSLAIFRRFSHQRTLFHHPAGAGRPFVGCPGGPDLQTAWVFYKGTGVWQTDFSYSGYHDTACDLV
ncbi:MAG: hypothetical protein WAN11_23850 [Syntrophobacteraceae bacterium]